VDVVPQAKRLRLTINMTYAEINDPKVGLQAKEDWRSG
jgi:predicted transport protein